MWQLERRIDDYILGVKGLKDEASYRAQDRSETQSETTQNQFGVMFDTHC